MRGIVVTGTTARTRTDRAASGTAAAGAMRKTARRATEGTGLGPKLRATSVFDPWGAGWALAERSASMTMRYGL